MKYDLKAACKNCPFGNTPTRIIFSCRERAEEIEESAYRNGFPCHLSAEVVEDVDGESEGYVAGPGTQHCAGAAAMFLNEGYDTWPGINNSSRIGERFEQRLTPEARASAFQDSEEFFAANESAQDKAAAE